MLSLLLMKFSRLKGRILSLIISLSVLFVASGFCLAGLSSCTVGDFSDVYEVTIKYYYNTETGSVESDECVLVVGKDSHIEGAPVNWSERRWKPNEKDVDLQYGYIGDGVIGVKDVRYRYTTDNNNWNFVSYYNKDYKWNTSERVERSMFLVPSYTSDEDVEESITINFLYNKTDSTEPGGYKVCREERTITKSEIESGVTLRKFQSGDAKISLFDKDQNNIGYGYGYMDSREHDKLFSYEPDSTQNMAFEYRYGNRVVDSDMRITLNMDGATFSPVYIPMGYRNIPASETEKGGIFGVEQVFIPGNVVNGEFHPYPYSQAGSQKLGKEFVAWGPSVGRADDPEYSIQVPDMYVTAEFIPSSLYNYVKTKYPELYAKYSLESAGDIGAAADYSKTYINSTSFVQSLCFANFLTEYYNLIHPDQEPLSCAYYNFDGELQKLIYGQDYDNDNNILRNCNQVLTQLTSGVSPGVLASNAKWLIYRDDATGFRLPYHNEWEYMMRIVTDERQLPDMSNEALYYLPCVPRGNTENEYYHTVIAPTSTNKYTHYFQSAAASFNTTSLDKVAYVGSGAGLAKYDKASGKYDKSTLRTFTDVTGRRANNVEIDADKVSMRNDSAGEENRNRMNGAGLWGMTGTYFQRCNGIIVNLPNHNTIIGGAKHDSIAGSLGFNLGFYQYGTDTQGTAPWRGGVSGASYRLCRSVYNNIR